MLVPVERVVAFNIVIRVVGARSRSGVYPTGSHGVVYEAAGELLAVMVLLRHVCEAPVVLRKVIRQILVGVDSGFLREQRQGAQDEAGC